MENGCDIRDIDDNGISVLSTALKAGSFECVKYLLEKDSSLVKQENDDLVDGHPPLVYYLTKCSPRYSIFSLLVEHGADVNYVDNNQQNLFHYVVMKLSENEDSLKILDVLLQKADLNLLNKRNKSNVTPPFLACQSSLKFLTKFLHTKRVDLTLRTINDEVPKPTQEVIHSESILHTSVRSKLANQNDDVMESFLQLYFSLPNTSINETNKYGMTALHLSCLLGYQKLTAQLCKFNPDFNFQNYWGNTPLHLSLASQSILEILIPYAPKHLPNQLGKTPLHLSIENHSSPTQVRLLCKMPSCDVNAVDNEGNTPIFYLSKDSIVVCFMLADHGAKFDLLNKIGESPLYCALNRKLVNVSFYLMSVIGTKINQSPPLHKDSLFIQAMRLKTDGLVKKIKNS